MDRFWACLKPYELFWRMYRPSCTVYYPHKQMHNIYIHIYIYKIFYTSYFYMFQCICTIFRESFPDDAMNQKHVAVLTIYIYIYIYTHTHMCVCCTVHLLVSIIKFLWTLFYVTTNNATRDISILYRAKFKVFGICYTEIVHRINQ